MVDIRTRTVPAEVVVVGAGAAGLAAVRTLTELGIDTLLLEARSRVGGRAYTLHTPGGLFPVELGAEFVHGNNAAMKKLLRESGAATIDVDGPEEIWDAAQRVLGGVDFNAADTSVDAFLKSVSGDGVDLTRMLIEGFDAAITADTSVQSIAREWRSDANSAQSRPAQGYDLLVHHLARDIGSMLMLDTRVERIVWSRGNVRVYASRYGENLEVRARAAIVTLPIGVLHEQAYFAPPLPETHGRALQALASGPVVKVVLEFREIFWDGAFLRPPRECGFPTIWSRMPQRAPVLVAWAGGDAVTRLREKSRDPVAAALDACAALFPQVDVRTQLRAAHWHDWQADPYALGAYSYLRVNGGGARAALAKPVEQTLFFAGEATSSDYAGTVSGALQTGERAAREAVGAVRL